MLTSTLRSANIVCAAVFALSCCVPLMGDVFLHYSFDADYQDSSANGNDGVLFDSSDDGSVLITADAAVFGAGGMAQESNDDRVDLSTPFMPADGTPWTIAFWCDLNGGAASYGFNSNSQHAIQVRADAENVVKIWVAGQAFAFDAAGIITQNSANNHLVLVGNPVGIDLDGVAGDDKFAVYANNQLLVPAAAQDLTDAAVSTAIEVTQLGDSEQWPYGAAGDYDEFWILDEALNANAVNVLYTQNMPNELWYVDADTVVAAGDQDGLSWATAFDDLQEALAVASERAMIWVADGIYYPVTPVDPANPTEAERSVSFELKAGQQLICGFKGYETSVDKPFNASSTFLSGDIGGVNSDLQSYHVVTVENADGVYIEDAKIQNGGDSTLGNAVNGIGGGLYVDYSEGIVVREVRFSNNVAHNGAAAYHKGSQVQYVDCEFVGNVAAHRGGAVFHQNSSSESDRKFSAINCLFEDNQAGTHGGAFEATYADSEFINCRLLGNEARFGGAIRTYRSVPILVNSVFARNAANDYGGALYMPSGGTNNLQVANCVFYDNTAVLNGHHIHTEGTATHVLVNSVIWAGDTLPASGELVSHLAATATYEHSLVQGLDLTGVGVGNLDGTLATHAPEFTEPASDDFTVRAYSPLVNAGTQVHSIVKDLDPYDVDGDGDFDEIYPIDLSENTDSRVAGAAIDIGAYEHEDPFEVGDPLVYDSAQVGESEFVFDFVNALDSDDDSLAISSSNTAVATLTHPSDEEEVDNSIGEVTVVGLGTATLIMDFQYQGGAVHRFSQTVTVSVQPLNERDLSALTDVTYLATDFGDNQAYADLAAIFTDSPTSFSVLTANSAVFTVSQTGGAVTIVPTGLGEADLTLRAHYSDGTVLEVVRSVAVELPAVSQAALDGTDDVDYTLGAGPFLYADLSAVLSDGATGILVRSSNEAVMTVSETGGVITITDTGAGTATLEIEIVYADGPNAIVERSIGILVTPLDERDLSAVVDVDHTAAQFGSNQTYLDLATVFTDHPDSYTVLSSDALVFTVSETSGVVTIVPTGFGDAELTLRAQYGDGTVLEVVRAVSVALPVATQAALDATEAVVYPLNGGPFTYADLGVALTDGAVAVSVSSSNQAVMVVHENAGVVTVSPQSRGSTSLTIEVEYNGGPNYSIQHELRVFDDEGELLAQYALDGDATDALGNHDAAVSVEGVTWTATELTTDEVGYLEMPDSLMSDFCQIDRSFELSFRFRVDEALEDGLHFLATLKQGNSVAARSGGFSIVYYEDGDQDDHVNIFFNYADGVDQGHYRWTEVATCAVGQWYDLKLVFDMDKDVWSLTIGDDYMTAPINNREGYSYDFDALVDVLQANRLRLGKFSPKNAQDEAEDAVTTLDSVKVYSPALEVYFAINDALTALESHVTGVTVLSDAELMAHYNLIARDINLTDYSNVLPAVRSYIQAYSTERGALFPTDTQVDTTAWDGAAQASLFVQQWVHSTLYTPESLDEVSDLVFADAAYFPGLVAQSEPRIASAVVTVDGDYATDPDAAYIWAERVLRPLGYYVPAGEVVTVSVDPAYINLGLKVVVGAHVRDLDPEKRPNINRFRDIAHEYDLSTASIDVASAFGGGLYISVPDGTSAGAIPVTIENAVKSVYFSARAGKETDVATWLAELAVSEVPWVDFESDKFMFTVPWSLAQFTTQPDLIMDRWDEIMDQYRFMNGRPLDGRIRAEYYLLDRMLVTPAWGAGYPLVVPVNVADTADSNWNPLNVLTIAPHRTLFHEFGHNCAIPGPVFEGGERVLADQSVVTLPSWAEGENLVNLPAVLIYNRVYGWDLDIAFANGATQQLTIDQAALDWMVTENFRNGEPISFDTTGVFDFNPNAMGELHYQSRGIGRYGDIARLFGWDALNLIQSEFYPIRDEDSFSPDGHRHRLYRDAFVRRASEVMNLNMAPLFHLWGIHPSDTLKAELATMPKSWGIKNQLEAYLNLVPTTRAEYDLMAAELIPLVGGYQDDRYDYYAGYFTDEDAANIGEQIESIIFEYGLDYTGDEPTSLNARQRPDGRVELLWESTASNETGFVVRYKASGAVAYIDLGTSAANVEQFITPVMPDGAYEFSVAVVYADGTESLPGELSIDALSATESLTVNLSHQVYDGVSFFNSDLTTEYMLGGGSGGSSGSSGSFQTSLGSSLKISAADILSAIQAESEDDSIDFGGITLQRVTLHLPSEFVSGPSVVEVTSDATPGYDAYAGGVNTTGSPTMFSRNSQSLDITQEYSLGEGRDFYFFLYNSSENFDRSLSGATLEIKYEVSDGYRYWSESHGLISGVDAYSNYDADGDGLPNLLEYALGLDPLDGTHGAAYSVNSGELAQTIEVVFMRGRDDIHYRIESTGDLQDWTNPSIEWDSKVDFEEVVPVGQEQRISLPIDQAPNRFYRLRVISDFDVDEIT